MRRVLVYILLFLFYPSLAQSPWIYENDYFRGWGILESYDGGVIILGTSQNFGQDGKVFKIDNTGQILWEHELEILDYNTPSHIVELEDGSIVIGGLTDKYDSELDGYLLKLDACGETVWFKNIGAPDEYDWITDMISVENDIVLTHFFSPGNLKYTLSKYSSENGDLIWSQSDYMQYGGTPRKLSHCLDGGFLVMGSAYFPPYYNQSQTLSGLRSVVFKTDSIGELEWIDVYNWEVDTIDNWFISTGLSSIQLVDSSFMILALDRNISGESPFILYKLSSEGELIWSQSMIDSVSFDNSILLTINDTALVAIASPLSPNKHLQILKLNTSGTVLTSYSDSSFFLSPRDVFMTDDDNLLVLPGAKSGNGDNWLYAMKFDLEMMLPDTFLINDTTNYDYLCSSVVTDQYITFPDDTISVEEYLVNKINISPNPAKDYIQVDLNQNSSYIISLQELSGRRLFKSEIVSETDSYILDISGYSPGIYIVEIYEKDKDILSQKLMIEQ